MPKPRMVYINTYRCAPMIPGMDYYECSIPIASKRVPERKAKGMRTHLMQTKCRKTIRSGPWTIPRCEVRIEDHPVH